MARLATFFIGVILAIFCTVEDSQALSSTVKKLKVTKFGYKGYKNVYHLEQPYQGYVAGELSAENKQNVLRTCANFCTLDSNCGAFFLRDIDGATCHLMDSSVANNYTIDHFGSFKVTEEKEYYLKEYNTLDEAKQIELPDPLRIPCDLDESQLADCSSLPTEGVKYFTCAASDPAKGATYADSVNQISDQPCTDEDRLIQCELHGERASSNVVFKRNEIMDTALMKSADQPAGTELYALDSEILKFLTVTFYRGPKTVTRVVVRTVGMLDDAGQPVNDHVSSAEVALRRSGEEEVHPLSFNPEHCAAAIDFRKTDSIMYMAADSLSLREIRVFDWAKDAEEKYYLTADSSIGDPVGYVGIKIDIFVAK